LVSGSNGKQKPKIANEIVSEREEEITTEIVSGAKDGVKEQLKQLTQAVEAERLYASRRICLLDALSAKPPTRFIE
jgi:hypothetical protein